MPQYISIILSLSLSLSLYIYIYDIYIYISFKHVAGIVYPNNLPETGWNRSPFRQADGLRRNIPTWSCPQQEWSWKVVVWECPGTMMKTGRLRLSLTKPIPMM